VTDGRRRRVVVVFGGLGSLAGCFIASILMGMVQTFSVVFDYSFADVLKPFGVTLADNDLSWRIWRPQGGSQMYPSGARARPESREPAPPSPPSRYQSSARRPRHPRPTGREPSGPGS